MWFGFPVGNQHNQADIFTNFQVNFMFAACIRMRLSHANSGRLACPQPCSASTAGQAEGQKLLLRRIAACSHSCSHDQKCSKSADADQSLTVTMVSAAAGADAA